MSPPEPLTITDAAPLIRSGALTPSDLLEQCLARVDVYEPAVKAWVYLDRERARRDAARLTDELKQGHHRGPLHGIPVGIKDIIDVFDMPTGCGSKLWANSYARRDATCVERLRQAGAVILGKTVTTPYAFTDPPVTRNPWNLDRTPGGSSSGSAAAVACGMCLAALGTQTGGSLTRPASYCGVCSLKPTYGRVSVDGVLPLAPSLDHVGVIAGCVRDLAVVYEVIAGPDGRPNLGDAYHGPVAEFDPDAEIHSPPSFIRLGGVFDRLLTDEARHLFEAALQRLAEANGPCERSLPPAVFPDIFAAHRLLMGTEAADFHHDRIDRIPGDYPSNIARLVTEGLAHLATHYTEASRLRDDLRVTLTRMLTLERFFLAPATTDLPPSAETTGDPVFNVPWSFAGLPTISVPVGRTPAGLPFAVQIAAGEDREPDLFATAAWVESVLEFPRTLPPIPPR